MCEQTSIDNLDKHLLLLIEGVSRVVQEQVIEDEGLCLDMKLFLMQQFGEAAGILTAMRVRIGTMEQPETLEDMREAVRAMRMRRSS